VIRISVPEWWRQFCFAAEKFLADWHERPRRVTELASPSDKADPAKVRYGPLERVELTDEVSRTLFEEYAAHRLTDRGHEEIGWMLLGTRGERDALVLATLPAGDERSASSVHVRFNSHAQAVAARMVRQWNRQLVILGIVHTHPGSMRHPSDGDLSGDRVWIQQLRGREGIFAIGTADAPKHSPDGVMWQPTDTVQCLTELRLSWYTLRHGEYRYRPMDVTLTVGPDYARPLRPIWSVIETHAAEIDRLMRQQQNVRLEPLEGDGEAMLAVFVPLAEPESALRVLISDAQVRYQVIRGGEILEADMQESQVDRGVYLMLAELARHA